ncbi:MAG: winged helix-turn-helix domain-containing protein [Xanthomonadales bacterium]|nr:winged helix-turn-helix domain-containing protein [Xanthomonadales bacterium]
MTKNQRFQLADITIDPATNRLSRGADSVSVEPRAMQVLRLLLERRGEVVSRREIFDQVWRSADITDDSLNRLVFDLRKAFKALDPEVQAIETIRKVGYRVAAADPAEASKAPAGRRPWMIGLALAAASVGTVLVLTGRTGGPVDESPTIEVFSNQLGFETHPSFHPDGQQVVFTCSTDGSEKLGLCLQGLGDPAPGVLLVDGGEGAAFHPDGQRIAYQASDTSGCEIRIFHLGDQKDTLLTRCNRRNDGSLGWSADGQHLFFSDSPDGAAGPFHIRSVPVNGGPVSAVTRPPVNSVGDLYPAPSPDGQSLAFFRADRESTLSTYVTPGIGRVYRAPLSGSLRDEGRPVEPLTSTAAEITGLDWLGSGADADLLFFSNARDNRFALWRLSPGQESPTVYGGFSGIIRQPAISADGMVIAESWAADADIYSRSLLDPADRGTVVFSSSRYDFGPAVSPDGTRLAWVSTRSGRPRVWIGELDGNTILGPIELDHGAEAESPRWSPDSQKIVFEMRQRGQSRLVVYTLDARAKKILDLPGDNRVPSWSIDGSAVYHASDRSGVWQVWRYDLDTTASAQITSGGAYAQREYLTRQDRGLVFSRRDQPGLWKQSFADASTEQIVADLPQEYWGNWTVRGSEVFFSLNDSAGPQVFSVDLETGQRKSRLALEQPLLRESTNLAVTPDGTTVYFAVRSRISADLIRFSVN